MLIEREQQCPACGHRDDEWGEWVVEPDGRRVLKPFQPPPFEAKTHLCPACEARETRQRAAKDGLPPGVTVVLERTVRR